MRAAAAARIAVPYVRVPRGVSAHSMTVVKMLCEREEVWFISVALRYANRAKNIKNMPNINEDTKDAMLR